MKVVRFSASRRFAGGTEKGRVGLKELAGSTIPESWVKQHEFQSQAFHFVQGFAVRHAPFVEGDKRQLQLDANTVVEKIFRTGQDAALISLHVDLEEESALVCCEVSPYLVELTLLGRHRRYITGFRSGRCVAIEHGQNRAACSVISRDVQDDFARIRTERVRDSRPEGVARCSVGQFRIRIREGLERDDVPGITEAAQLRAEAAIARPNVEDMVDLVPGQKAGSMVTRIVVGKAGDVQADKLDDPARTMEQCHRGRLDAVRGAARQSRRRAA